MTQVPRKPARVTGLAHVLAAARYSAGGCRRLLGEAAFRHELLAAGAVIGLFALTGAPWWAYPGFAILALITFAVEALNTAIEELVDQAAPGWAEFAKHAKDLGSFAVMCLLVACGLFVLVALSI